MAKPPSDGTNRRPHPFPWENRTITVDFHDETIYYRLFDDGHAFFEFVLAFILSIGVSRQ